METKPHSPQSSSFQAVGKYTALMYDVIESVINLIAVNS